MTRQDWRSFRLDRLTNPRSTTFRFSPRELPAKDAASFVRSSIGNLSPAPHACEAVIYAPAATVRARVGQWAKVDELDDHTCRLQMTADNLDWPALALGVVGADFEVRSPPELVDYLRDWAVRFTRATSTTPSS
jgi:predicted DNA-binding transcriptional regulator YafY